MTRLGGQGHYRPSLQAGRVLFQAWAGNNPQEHARGVGLPSGPTLLHGGCQGVRNRGHSKLRQGHGPGPPTVEGQPVGAWAWAAGSRGSLDKRALVLLTLGERNRSCAPLPADHTVALGVGVVSPFVHGAG